MRQLLRAGVLACLLLFVFVSTASAAVTIPTNSYFAQASFTFVDRDVEWSGSIIAMDDRLNGVLRTSVFFTHLGPDRVCNAGTPDEFVANDEIDFFGQQYRTTANIRSDLSSAGLEITASGETITVDGCTGEITSSRSERHRLDAKLMGTGEISTETSDVLIELPDGTIVPGTSTTSTRLAIGKVEIDNIGAVVTDASLFHGVTQPN